MLNAVRPALVLAAALLGAIAVSPASADEQSFPNWQSCGLDFWANATDLRDLRLGVAVSNQRGKNAALLAEILSEKSETDALMTIHAVYEKCVNGLVKDGRWTAEPQLIKWRDCAYQSATRFNILVAIEQGHLD